MVRRSVLITGTGTGVGKTFISANLAYTLKESGFKVGYYKPIETGVEDTPLDGALLCQITGQDLEEAVPLRCKLPLAPYACTLEEGVEFDIKFILDHYKKLMDKYHFLIVEGAGGLAVPIKSNYNYAHLANDLDIPILLVSYASLGTIHHTYTTHFYAKSMGLKILGVVMNGFRGADISERTNPRIVRELTGLEVVETPWQESLILPRTVRDRIAGLIRL